MKKSSTKALAQTKVNINQIYNGKNIATSKTGNNEKDQVRRKAEIDKIFKSDIIDYDKLKEFS